MESPHNCQAYLNRHFPNQVGKRWDRPAARRCSCGRRYQYLVDRLMGDTWIPYVKPCFRSGVRRYRKVA